MAEIEIIIGDHQVFGDRMRSAIDLVNRGLKAGPVVVTLGRPKRSGAQNRHFHALIGEIAQQVEVGGRKYSQDVWKALLVDQFSQEMESAGTPLSKPGRTVPSLDGRRAVTVRPSTTDLKKAEAAQFITFLNAFGDEHGVQWSAQSLDMYEKYAEIPNENR